MRAPPYGSHRPSVCDGGGCTSRRCHNPAPPPPPPPPPPPTPPPNPFRYPVSSNLLLVVVSIMSSHQIKHVFTAPSQKAVKACSSFFVQTAESNGMIALTENVELKWVPTDDHRIVQPLLTRSQASACLTQAIRLHVP